MPKLIHTEGGAAREYPLGDQPLTIGREAGNTIKTADAKASREHFRIDFVGGRHQVSDLGSSNGTLVNGAKIMGPTILSNGDLIKIGSAEFQFVDDAPPAPASFGDRVKSAVQGGVTRFKGWQEDRRRQQEDAADAKAAQDAAFRAANFECQTCRAWNPNAAQVCGRCGMPFRDQAALQVWQSNRLMQAQMAQNQQGGRGMAQFPPHQTNVIVTQVVGRGGGGCLSGLGMGMGATCGGIGVIFLFFILGGVFCLKTCEAVGTAAKNAHEEVQKREAEEAKKYVLVRWKRDDSVLARNKFTEADKAKQFVGFSVEVENQGYDSVAINSSCFSLTASGLRTGELFALVNPKLDATDLKNGAKASGGVAFEVSDATKPVSLVFKPTASNVKNVRYESK